MKKHFLFLILTGAMIASCKKEPPTDMEPTITIRATPNTGAAGTPGIGIELYRVEISTNTVLKGAIANRFVGTVDPSMLEHMQIVYRFNGRDSLVQAHPYVQSGVWPIVEFPKGTTTVSVYVDAPRFFIGSIQAYVQVVDEYRVGVTSEYNAGTTVLGYNDPITVKTAPVATDPIVNGTERDIIIIQYGGTPGMQYAIKGPPAIRTVFVDNGADSVLMFTDLRVRIVDQQGQRDITDSVNVIDSLGVVIDTLRSDRAAHRKLQIVYKAGYGAMTVSSGTQTIISATPQGFGAPTDPDLFQADVVPDVVSVPESHTYLNKGTAFGEWIKLFSGPTANAGANQYRQNFVWKTIRPGEQTVGSYGISSSGWRNGYGIVFNTQPTVIHTKGALSKLQWY